MAVFLVGSIRSLFHASGGMGAKGHDWRCPTRKVNLRGRLSDQFRKRPPRKPIFGGDVTYYSAKKSYVGVDDYRKKANIGRPPKKKDYRFSRQPLEI